MMKETFFATLTPMLMLFCCILIGFLARKAGALPEQSGKVMAGLELWIFCPALSFSTMATYFTRESLAIHGTSILFASLATVLSIAIAIPLSRLFSKKGSYERGVYQYALAFANCGYMGDPIVLALFGGVGLSYYKLYCLPLQIGIYTWGLNVLTPKDRKQGSVWKKIFNPPTVAMLFGMVVGVLGIGAQLPAFVSDSLDALKACMGPVAMLLAGFTIAGYSVASMLKKGRVYLATLLRLTLLPAVLVGVLFCVKLLVNCVFSLEIDHTVLFLCFFATATPLGLNTVVFPEAYGGDPETGASMAMISHTLCVISIPLMYVLMTALFGAAPL